MSVYHRILLAVDLTEESVQVGQAATRLAAAFGAQLHVLHAIEPLSLAYGGDLPLDLSSVQDEIHKQAKSHLAEFAVQLDIPPQRQWLAFGRPESEIHRIAETQNIDLVVIGSHGRHGLGLLLGSTANGVLHGAKCDVLAVRVGAASFQRSEG